MSRIRLLDLVMEGFLSFRDEIELDLEPLEGKTVQIDGRNLDDTLAISNGAGKSNLLEAAAWLLFGKILKNNRYADEVIHKKSSGTWVSGNLEIDGVIYGIFREKPRNKSTILYVEDGDQKELWADATTADKQVELEKLLGWDFDAFRTAVMFGQDFRAFPDLKPSERSKLLSNLRGLEKFDISARKASARAGALEKDKNAVEGELAVLDGRLGELSELAKTAEASQSDFEQNRKAAIVRYQEEKKQVKASKSEQQVRKAKEIAEAKEMTEAAEREWEAAAEKYEEWNAEELEDMYQRAEGERTRISGQITFHKNVIVRLQKDRSKIEALEGSCPTCGQDISSDHVESSLAEVESKLSKEQKLLSEAETELGKARERTQQIRDEKDQCQLAHNNYQAALRKREAARHLLQSAERPADYSQYDERIRRIDEKIAETKNSPNPWAEEKKKLRAKIKEIKTQQKDKKLRIAELEEEIRRYQFWKTGFKKIQLSAFDQIIDAFESAAQSALREYTSDINIRFETERETKGGNVRDEFHIVIEDGTGPISYELYSGGERQKVKLAVSLALADIVEERCGRAFNLIGFDEPNDGLDEAGRDANFAAFQNKANQGRIVLVTDHNAFFTDKFDHSIIVEKKGGASRIVEN